MAPVPFRLDRRTLLKLGAGAALAAWAPAGAVFGTPTGLRAFGEIEFAMQAYMADFDVLLSPVQPIVQPAIDVYDPNGSFDKEADSIRSFMTYTAFANATGAPAMSVPLHWTPGVLPLGAHFSALPGRDRTLLELAFELEDARPWKDRWAPHSIHVLEKESR